MSLVDLAAMIAPGGRSWEDLVTGRTQESLALFHFVMRHHLSLVI